MTSASRILRAALSYLCVLLILLLPGGGIVLAQDFGQNGPPPPVQGPPPPQPQGAPQQSQLLSPDQLDDLVAPIALYPDNLLSQVLAASTYPLEIVEASQWLQQNRNLQGQQLADAARQQNWDPSIQAMVVFPDVLNRLAADVQWTTALGNAFLAQQQDVMNAVQKLRAEARASGKLNSSPQQTVTTQTQDGQSAVQIMPANPQEVYVPEYNPYYVWGPPAYGYYPPLYYPPVAYGFGFYPGIYLGGFFPGLGWGLGFGGWGWGLNWFGGFALTNAFFFNHYGFHGWYGGGGRLWAGAGGFRGGAWAHNPEHRMGVPYANRSVANRFGGSYARSGSFARSSQAGGFTRGGNSGFSNSGAARSFAAPGNRGTSGGFSASRGSAPGFRSSPSYGGSSGFRSAPSYSSPVYRGGSGSYAPAYRSGPSSGSFRSAPSYSAPRSSGSFGGGSFHGSSGSSFHGGGGGSFHSSGGSHGGGGGSHGGGGGHGGHR